MVGIVVLQIVYSGNRQNYCILVQIIVLGLNIAWSQLFIFPSLIGVDPWFHQMLAERIQSENFIPNNLFYSKLPIFHLIISLTSLISNLPYKQAVMLSVSLGLVVSNVLLIFLLGRFITKDHKIGLMGSLFIVISPYHIVNSFWSIPNSLALVFIPLIFYLYLKIKILYPIRAMFISFIFMVTLILTHTITSLFLAILFFSLMLEKYFYYFFYSDFKSEGSTSTVITHWTFVLFSVSMLTYWGYASGILSTFSNLIKWGFSVDYFTRPTPIGMDNYLSQNIMYLDNLSTFIFFSFSLIGVLYMMSRNGNELSFIMSLLGLIPLALGFFSLITGHSIIEERWWFFSQLFLSIPLAISVILIVSSFKERKCFFSLSFVIIIALFALLSLLSPTANIDNPLISPHSSYRPALTASEFAGFETADRIWDGKFKTDYYSAKIDFMVTNRRQDFSFEIIDKKFDKLYGFLILLRKDILDRPSNFSNLIIKLNYDPRITLDEKKFLKIYNSDSVEGYIKFE